MKLIAAERVTALHRQLAMHKAELERLRQAVEGSAIPHRTHRSSEMVTISAGLAMLLPGQSKSIDTVLQEADAALYRAKEGGRNRIAV